MLGKETIDMNTYGQSHGRNGSYTTNWQLSGRELLTADEVRMIDNRYAVLFIRGERPIMDEKYDILRHPNVALSKDGGAPAFIHGATEFIQASVAISPFIGEAQAIELPEGINALDLELLSEEEVYEITKDK